MRRWWWWCKTTLTLTLALASSSLASPIVAPSVYSLVPMRFTNFGSEFGSQFSADFLSKTARYPSTWQSHLPLFINEAEASPVAVVPPAKRPNIFDFLGSKPFGGSTNSNDDNDDSSRVALNSDDNVVMINKPQQFSSSSSFQSSSSVNCVQYSGDPMPRCTYSQAPSTISASPSSSSIRQPPAESWIGARPFQFHIPGYQPLNPFPGTFLSPMWQSSLPSMAPTRYRHPTMWRQFRSPADRVAPPWGTFGQPSTSIRWPSQLGSRWGSGINNYGRQPYFGPPAWQPVSKNTEYTTPPTA